jgi:hypothetical protein
MHHLNLIQRLTPVARVNDVDFSTLDCIWLTVIENMPHSCQNLRTHGRFHTEIPGNLPKILFAMHMPDQGAHSRGNVRFRRGNSRTFRSIGCRVCVCRL